MSTENDILLAWRELGFYSDFDDRLEVNQWRFYGSKTGLLRFIALLAQFVADPGNDRIGEHEHYGPYWNLKLMTTAEPKITTDGFQGTISDLAALKESVAVVIDKATPGMTFCPEYGVDNEATVRFFMMADNFDPGSLDELILSNRQQEVNSSKTGK